MSAEPRLPSGYRLLTFECIGSTNDEAKRLAALGAPHGTVVWAREQTAGRGRQGRRFDSPRGNLYFSLILRPGRPIGDAVQLGMVAAVATAEALEALADGAEVRLKWPNDVLVNGAKACGILLESAASGPKSVEWLVLGIGVNIENFPEDTEFPATSLRAVSRNPVTVENALEVVTNAFSRWFEEWRAKGFAPLRKAWLARAWRRGGMLQVRIEGALIGGRFHDLDETGALLLEVSNGSLRRITAADVFALPLTA